MNKKIERIIADIDKTKAAIALHQAKLRELEQRKTALENAEIVALYRKERMTEDEFRAYIQSRREVEAAPVPSATIATDPIKKEIPDDED